MSTPLVLYFPYCFDEIKYPAGEFQVRLKPNLVAAIKESADIAIRVRSLSPVYYRSKGQDFGTMSDMLVKLVLLNDAIVGVNPIANRILEIPYLPYSRGDRRFVDGDCNGLGTIGDIINTCGFAEVRTLDMHSSAGYDYIRNLVDIEPTRYVKDVIKSIRRDGKLLTVLFPDDGAMKRYRSLVSDGDTRPDSVSFATKVRDKRSGKLVKFEVPDASFLAPNVLIIDDICDGGGTFLGVADELRYKGFTGNLFLYVTHGIFSKGLVELQDRFCGIFTTDSVSGCASDLHWSCGSGRGTSSPYVESAFEIMKTGTRRREFSTAV